MLLTTTGAGAVEILQPHIQITPGEVLVRPARIAAVADDRGGFAIFWDSDTDKTYEPDKLFVRFYNGSLEADGSAIQFGEVSGNSLPITRLQGAVGLGNGEMLATWNMPDKDNSAKSPLGLGQLFKNGRKKGNVRKIETGASRFLFQQMLAPVELSDGRAVAPLLEFANLNGEPDYPTRVRGRFISSNGELGPRNIKLKSKNVILLSLFPIKTGFSAMYYWNQDGRTRARRHLAEIFDTEGHLEGRFSVFPGRKGFAPPKIIELDNNDIITISTNYSSINRVFAACFKRDGSRTCPDTQLLEDAEFVDALALPGGDFLLVSMASSSEFRFYRFNRDFNLIGGVARRPAPRFSYGAVRILSDGRILFFYVADSKFRDIYAQILVP